MRSMVIDSFGDTDVLEERDRPMPEPGPGEIRVRVHATSVNPLDCRVRREGDSMGLSAPMVVGYDASGVVDAVGAGVESVAEGDAVFYTPELFEDGCYAEYNVVPAHLVSRKPATLSHQEAAALPVAACTAWDALVERAGLEVGESVFVHGAGGVGQQIIQIAAAAGAEVYASASPETADIAERLGATDVVNYRTGDFTAVVSESTDGQGVDVIVDTVGGGLLAESFPILRPHGQMVDIVGDPGDIGNEAKLNNTTVSFMALTRGGDKMNAVRKLVERGQVQPVIDSVCPLSEAADAHERIQAGGVAGKIVLTVN